jgi:hypothetical protein
MLLSLQGYTGLSSSTMQYWSPMNLFYSPIPIFVLAVSGFYFFPWALDEFPIFCSMSYFSLSPSFSGDAMISLEL